MDLERGAVVRQIARTGVLVAALGLVLYGAAALVCRAIAARYAREVDSAQNELRTMWSSRTKAYRDLAQQLDVQAANSSFATPFAGGINVADKIENFADSSLVKPQFNLGMTDSWLPVGPAGNEVQLRGSCS